MFAAEDASRAAMRRQKDGACMFGLPYGAKTERLSRLTHLKRIKHS